MQHRKVTDTCVCACVCIYLCLRPAFTTRTSVTLFCIFWCKSPTWDVVLSFGLRCEWLVCDDMVFNGCRLSWRVPVQCYYFLQKNDGICWLTDWVPNWPSAMLVLEWCKGHRRSWLQRRILGKQRRPTLKPRWRVLKVVECLWSVASNTTSKRGNCVNRAL